MLRIFVDGKKYLAREWYKTLHAKKRLAINVFPQLYSSQLPVHMGFHHYQKTWLENCRSPVKTRPPWLSIGYLPMYAAQMWKQLLALLIIDSVSEIGIGGVTLPKRLMKKFNQTPGKKQCFFSPEFRTIIGSQKTDTQFFVFLYTVPYLKSHCFILFFKLIDHRFCHLENGLWAIYNSNVKI